MTRKHSQTSLIQSNQMVGRGEDEGGERRLDLNRQESK